MTTTTTLPPYRDFIAAKSQLESMSGFEPTYLPDCLFDFQRHLVSWAIRKGRAALFEDCGLGKTIQQLVWAENVVRHTNRPVLILTPLAVSHQTVREAEKFGIEAARSANGKIGDAARIVVTNYERLHYFNAGDFAGVVADESSCLKDFDSVRKAAVTEFMRTRPYRLLCTATAAPNDYDELGTSAEALGELGYSDMVTKFFRQVTKKDFLGWGRTKHVLRTHAEEPFWRWVCSWARACRRPSDLGFGDDRFSLPPLTTNEHRVEARRAAPGFLFDLGAVTLREQQEEQRRTIEERCGTVASLVTAHGQPALVWCHLNDEADLCERLIPGAVQVSGSDADEAKEERFIAFVNGDARVLVTKGKCAGFGLNFQHCAHQTFFPSNSFELYYQCVRRSWRFGQTRPVTVDMITTDGSHRVMENLRRKTEAAEHMFSRLVELMNASQRIERSRYGTQKAKVPAWL